MTKRPKFKKELTAFLKQPAFIVGIACTALGFGISQGVEHFKDSRKDHEKLVAQRVITFIDTTREFDALVPALAHGIMDKNAPDLSARAKLITNLNRQFSEVGDFTPILKDRADLIDEYKKSLSQLNRDIQKVNNVEGMKIYWEGVGRVLSARKELASNLRRVTKLDRE